MSHGVGISCFCSVDYLAHIVTSSVLTSLGLDRSGRQFVPHHRDCGLVTSIGPSPPVLQYFLPHELVTFGPLYVPAPQAVGFIEGVDSCSRRGTGGPLAPLLLLLTMLVKVLELGELVLQLGDHQLEVVIARGGHELHPGLEVLHVTRPEDVCSPSALPISVKYDLKNMSR